MYTTVCDWLPAANAVFSNMAAMWLNTPYYQNLNRSVLGADQQFVPKSKLRYG